VRAILPLVNNVSPLPSTFAQISISEYALRIYK
jgi:hypothetical protein